MSLTSLLDIVYSGNLDNWKDRNEKALGGLLGGAHGRYKKDAERDFLLRAPEAIAEVPFTAYIHPSNPKSGAYSGMSFAIFPLADQPALITLVVGTQGLSPDEAILGRPGHARKCQAICKWLNATYGTGELVAWAKHDPTRTDMPMPRFDSWSDYKSVFDRYGKEIYAVYRPTDQRTGTEEALSAFLDLLFEERGYQPMSASRADSERVQASWFKYLMPPLEEESVSTLLDRRRFVIIQGPPGTGKTRLAENLRKGSYANNGMSIQFHPNTSYETFIGGLAPSESRESLGFRFDPKTGFLMQAAAEAQKNYPKKYLLHIDEINRADLGKILGEAIYLLEPTDTKRKIKLAYDFGEPFHSELQLPDNLHILGTMNSSDRSIAILDVAVRRRFAFLTLMPQFRVVQEHGCKIMQDIFRKLMSIFVEHAPDDVFNLMPGHSYFLESKEDLAKQNLQTNLTPLLDEYLAQGYVSGFAEPIRGFLQELAAL